MRTNVDISAITLGLIGAAFVIGMILGWLLKRPQTLASASPEIEREKTLVEARHESFIEDIKAHLEDTEKALVALSNQQARLKATLNGDPLDVVTQTEEPIELEPPRDYASTRGQLQ